MRLLDRYLLRELLTPLAFCLGGFLVFWVSFDLFSELNNLQTHQLRAGEILLYEVLRTPQFFAVVLPVALLLALLYALTQHAKHHELTAIRAAGVSLMRLSAPYLAVGFAASVVLFAVNEFLAPRGAEAAQQLVANHQIGKRPASPFQKIYFRNSRDNRIWALDYNLATHEMRNVRVDWMRTDGTRLIFSAASGRRENGVWTFSDVQSHVFLPTSILPTHRVITNFMAMPEFAETPAQIKSEIAISIQSSKAHVEQTQIPLADLFSAIRLDPHMAAKDKQWVYTQLHSRLATPWTCLVVVLIAIPFGAMSGRRNVFFGVAGSVFICFVYFVLLQFGLALGASGYLPAALAAWLPNLFFGLAGVAFTFKVR